jgi:hypothetical protein
LTLGESVGPLTPEVLGKFANYIDHPPALSPEPEDELEEDELEESVTGERTSAPGGEDREITPGGEDVGRLDVDTGGRNPLPQSVRFLCGVLLMCR